MTLMEARTGETYTVSYLELDRALRQRLAALGLTKGTDVRVLNRSREGSVILMVRGSRLALGRKFTESIHIREASYNTATTHTRKVLYAGKA